MGRPLNKKYFGNRNIGSASTTADDGIGGSRVASVTLGTLGSYTTRPTVTFSLPDLTSIGAVRATGTVTSEVASVTATGGTQTGYTVGQLVTVDGTDAVLRVATIGGTGGDDALTFDFTGGSRGTFTTLPSGAQTTTSNGAGAGLTVTLAFRAKAVVITEPGSGYTDAADAAPTFTQSVTGTSVVEADGSGNASLNSAGTNENAFVVYAQTTSGGSRKVGDIVKQVGSKRFKVRTSDGTAICTLRTDGGSGVNTMDITAYDSDAGEYWVSKISNHRVSTVIKGSGGGSQFANDKSVPWTLGAATANVSVKLQNS